MVRRSTDVEYWSMSNEVEQFPTGDHVVWVEVLAPLEKVATMSIKNSQAGMCVCVHCATVLAVLTGLARIVDLPLQPAIHKIRMAMVHAVMAVVATTTVVLVMITAVVVVVVVVAVTEAAATEEMMIIVVVVVVVVVAATEAVTMIEEVIAIAHATMIETETAIAQDAMIETGTYHHKVSSCCRTWRGTLSHGLDLIAPDRHRHGSSSYRDRDRERDRDQYRDRDRERERY
jgi:hypothetical protein